MGILSIDQQILETNRLEGVWARRFVDPNGWPGFRISYGLTTETYSSVWRLSPAEEEAWLTCQEKFEKERLRLERKFPYAVH